MSTVTIRGIPVVFPFEPYELQKEYMEKVIECLENETNGVLESPTGTGKTLSLLCSSLAWLTVKKAQAKAHRYSVIKNENGEVDVDPQRVNQVLANLNDAFCYAPSIIYTSRTHTQLAQAVQELRKTAYGDLRAVVIGSRDLMCVHPDVVKEESNSAKMHLCKLKVATRSCHFNNRVETMKNDPCLMESNVLDIEDLVSIGKKNKFCPYFMAKELKTRADIIFMPYNYLIDNMASKMLGISLDNNVVIVDEAHNVEKKCEESGSIEIKSSDITLCIEEVTEVMKALTEGDTPISDEAIDFNAEDLCVLKEILLSFEKVLDDIEIKPLQSKADEAIDGDYIYDMFKKAGVGFTNASILQSVIEKIVTFLQTTNLGPFQRKGNGLELFMTLLQIVFVSDTLEYKSKMKRCYKVYVCAEEPFKKLGNTWLSKGQSVSKANGGRILNYWCFSPEVAMKRLINSGVRSIILTSGTLAPLNPLISELELDVQVRLENPHIIKDDQVVVRVVSKGPDGVELNCNYQNRDNPLYIASLGRTILNLSRIIPNGLLIFFPSYPIMLKCQQQWQEEGIWGNISDQKAVYVEPKHKHAFTVAMNEYYARIQDPQYKGAIFMGVCRGKVSEGLDFVDANGRAVIIIGLPYPPLKDPKVILKRQYLDKIHLKDREFPSGDDWYTLEATRAVNQAMGRVIRHRFDYGAIILLDSRFGYNRIQSQMSAWLRKRLKLVNNFGEIIRDLREFFRYATTNYPLPEKKHVSNPSTSFNATTAEFGMGTTSTRKGNFDFSTSTAFSTLSSQNNVVKTYNRKINSGSTKRKRITLVADSSFLNSESEKNDNQEYIDVVRNTLNHMDFKAFVLALKQYRDTKDFDSLIVSLDKVFLKKYSVRYIIQGLERYIKDEHKSRFEVYWEKMR